MSQFILIQKRFLSNGNNDDTYRFNVSVKKSSFVDCFDGPQDLETKS